MEGVNKKQVLDKFKNSKELYRRINGGSVVGQTVDDNNRLIYVIKEKGKTRLSYAEDEEIVPRIIIQEVEPEIKRINLKEMMTEILQSPQEDQPQK